MRYTRLRKAVEAGHFKGATLAHPAVISASMVQLANPQARRFGNSPQQRLTGSADEIAGATLYTGAARPIELDEEDEDEDEEDELEDIEESESLVDRDNGRKRRASNMVEVETAADNQLFYPDTSRSSRALKRIKRSDSDDEQEEDEEHTPSKSTRNTAALTRQRRTTNTITTSLPTRAYKQQGPQQIVSTDFHGSPSRPSLPLGVSTRSGLDGQRPSNDSPPVKVSRKKKSANDAAKAAYEVGVTTGRWAPHPDDNSVSNDQSRHLYSVNHTPTLRYVGHALHSPSGQSTRPTANADANMSCRDAPKLQPYPNMSFHMPRSQHPASVGPFHQTPSNPFATGQVPLPISHQESHYRSHQPEPLPQAEDYPPPRRYNPSDPNRFHPASVFDGFQMPTTAPPPSKGTAAEVKRTGEPSLLQKVVMNKQKETEGKAASHEKDTESSVAVDNSQPVKSGGKSAQTVAKTGVADNEVGEHVASQTESTAQAPVQARVHGSNGLRSDRPYALTGAGLRGNTAIISNATTRENAAAGVGVHNDKVKKENASQETIAGNPQPEGN